MERFIKEYANYKKGSIKNSDLMKEEYKNNIITKIDKVLAAREKGLITIDETIRYILRAEQ